MRGTFAASAAAIALLASSACSDDGADELGITCDGKCDGLSSIKALVADAKKLDLGDLMSVGAGFATDALDGALASNNYAQLQLVPTELYAPSSVAAGDLTLNNIDTLTSGLATRYGEHALTTEVNAIRREHLMQSGARVYAEAAFKIKAALHHDWTLATKGFGSDANSAVTLGFDAGTDLEARVITANARESSALVQSPLAAVKAARGFVLPRSVEDLQNMAPGESFALHGSGRLGLNLGAGVPILVANPASWLTYSLVLTAGMRSVFEGTMDVQVVRMRGNEVVIDAGVETSKVSQASIALTDGWGIHGLVKSSFEIAGQNVDLGKLLDKALQARVANKLSLIKAQADRTRTTMRMSVARMRFDLGGPDPQGARSQALAQAMRGDLRLAQALAARGDSGVVADFDLVRSGAAAMSSAGLDLVGMRFYRQQATSQGSAVIQTPGGALAMMWESLHKAGGWFFTSHGFTRIGVAGLRFDASKPGAIGETNLFVQTEEGDKFMERDKVIDQLDSVIVSVGGLSALQALEQKGNQLEQLVLTRCPLPTNGGYFDEACNVSFAQSSEAMALRNGALADLDAAVSSLPADSRDLLHSLADLRLAAQSIEDPAASLVGPTASIVVDFRLDDAALKAMFGKDRTAVSARIVDLMKATQLDRLAGNASGARDSIASKSKPTADKMAELFDQKAKDYQRLVSIDGATIDTLGAIGANAIEVRYQIDSGNRPKYETAVSESVAQARSGVATSLYDSLRDLAGQMPGSGGSSAPHAEQLAGFALLALAPPVHTELRVNFQTDNSTCGTLCGPRARYDAAGFVTTDKFAHGMQSTPIATGLFDIDAIISAPQ